MNGFSWAPGFLKPRLESLVCTSQGVKIGSLHGECRCSKNFRQRNIDLLISFATELVKFDQKSRTRDVSIGIHWSSAAWRICMKISFVDEKNSNLDNSNNNYLSEKWIN